ncbi:hypothetical protein HMPREF0970_01425 [Schaalia odontolytica F0309]|nr:hypothetical protein HMPREF0970_01425 [Schaalia odontolytica F0309]
MILVLNCLVAGSSPLTRGKHRIILPTDRPVRPIPAHAGKTCCRRKTWGRGQAHPRSRGENIHGLEGARRGVGSSPLTRGKRGQESGCYFVEGLIPAHAGRTWLRRFPMTGRTAHPRSHGENEALAASDATDKGSSPLTRGKHVAGVRRGAGGRLIPAHAGKTSTASRALVGVSAHPRSRGENVGRRAVATSWRGSSPLTRGKRYRERDAAAGTRLIPAHAGKTTSISDG